MYSFSDKANRAFSQCSPFIRAQLEPDFISIRKKLAHYLKSDSSLELIDNQLTELASCVAKLLPAEPVLTSEESAVAAEAVLEKQEIKGKEKNAEKINQITKSANRKQTAKEKAKVAAKKAQTKASKTDL